MGTAYDEERHLQPYKGGRHFDEIKDFFGERCCYCGVEFGPAVPAVQDHLIPMNKADLGLHAWGNIVPACQACNAKSSAKTGATSSSRVPGPKPPSVMPASRPSSNTTTTRPRSSCAKSRRSSTRRSARSP